MKLTIFQSDKGDSVLLTGDDGRRMLVDGGMRDSFTRHVSPTLNHLHAQGGKLDVVYVSHIDEDHISGVLQLMDDLVEWRVHEFHLSNGNADHPEPESLRPPEVKAIWHNAFHEQVGKNAGEIKDMLAATATVLSGADTKVVKALAEFHSDLATSTAQAIQLSRRVGPKQLNIDLNPAFQGKLMLVDGHKAIKLGGMSLFVIGPFDIDLKNLRDEWNTWLKEHQTQLKKISAQAKADEEELGNSAINQIIQPALAQAKELGKVLLSQLPQASGKVLGRRKMVTTPNLASLMFLVEEKGKTLLLTGDGHADDILKGLAHYGKLDANGGIHVDVLKVQHHGSEHNLHRHFARSVTADNYVFCGNGAHENPDLDVVEAIIDSRLTAGEKSGNPQVSNPFKLWFNSSSSNTETAQQNADHMAEVESLVRQMAKQSKGKMKFTFLKGHKMELTV